MNIPKSEIEKIQENMRRMSEFNRKFSELPEAKHQALLFRSWLCLCNITQQMIGVNQTYSFFCPKCNKIESIKFDCGLTIDEARTMLRELIPEHAQKVKQARKREGIEYNPI